MDAKGTETPQQQAKSPYIHPNDINLDIQHTQDDRVHFSSVALEESGQKKKKQKVPRRILHFSDGVLEEYSTDEDEEEEPEPPAIDPKTLAWLPWCWYYMTFSAAKLLGAADFCGEKLAWWFGITSPKYQYAIDEYNRLKAEEEKEQQELEREREAEQRRMAEAMAGMEGAVNTTEDPASVPPTALAMTNSDSQPTSTPTAAVSQEKY